MINQNKRSIVKYSRLFSELGFSPLRSGNISVREQIGNEKGFLISPSGKKNLELKTSDIVFL